MRWYPRGAVLFGGGEEGFCWDEAVRRARHGGYATVAACRAEADLYGVFRLVSAGFRGHSLESLRQAGCCAVKAGEP